jgi:hypothetical protein
MVWVMVTPGLVFSVVASAVDLIPAGRERQGLHPVARELLVALAWGRIGDLCSEEPPESGGRVVAIRGAVSPGVSLPDYARQLLQMHDAVIGGSRSELRPRELVARSWARSMTLGLDPGARPLRDTLPSAEVARRRRGSSLHQVIDELRTVIGPVSDASHVLLVVTDADGIILWREGTSSVRRHADTLGFSEGADWREAMVGTNAIGTALAEAAPVQLFSAEHFEQAQHPWYCTASPIHDPRTGDLLGIIDVSGPALTLHPAIGALVDTARRLAEAQLWRHHEQRLERLRQSAAPVLATARGPMLLVDEHGWVAHRSGVAATERIAVPSPDQLLTVPGLGVCRPEPLAGGWLIRPADPGGPVVLDLDLSGTPWLQVRSGDSVWRCALTTRHTEILLLLQAAGRAGLSAQALSLALFGDGDHVVTVRAEVSRLRRFLGTLVESQPYRLAEGVLMNVPVVEGQPFLQRTSSAQVRALLGSAGAGR